MRALNYFWKKPLSEGCQDIWTSLALVYIDKTGRFTL